MLRIDCIDERPGVAPRLAVRLTVPRLAITTRDLIRARIELEVERLQAELSALGADESGPRTTQGDWLVRPDAVEMLLNGNRGPYGPGTGGRFGKLRNGAWKPDIDAMLAAALNGFERGSFVLFVRDRQLTALDEPIDLGDTGEVVFLRLIPMAGG